MTILRCHSFINTVDHQQYPELLIFFQLFINWENFLLASNLSPVMKTGENAAKELLSYMYNFFVQQLLFEVERGETVKYSKARS